MKKINAFDIEIGNLIVIENKSKRSAAMKIMIQCDKKARKFTDESELGTLFTSRDTHMSSLPQRYELLVAE